MIKNPRTRKFRQLLKHQHVRLSENDREFLADLSRVHFISDDMARENHYKDRQTDPTVRLNKLVDAGLLQRHVTHERGRGRVSVYQFANQSLAKAFGSKLSVFGANRSLQHELVVSRMYFELNRPSDFRKENQFSKKDQAMIQGHVGGDRNFRPDALFSSGPGSTVFVEADSGGYSKQQIRAKQLAWRNVKQVWGQPKSAVAPIKSGGRILAYRF